MKFLIPVGTVLPAIACLLVISYYAVLQGSCYLNESVAIAHMFALPICIIASLYCLSKTMLPPRRTIHNAALGFSISTALAIYSSPFIKPDLVCAVGKAFFV